MDATTKINMTQSNGTSSIKQRYVENWSWCHLPATDSAEFWTDKYWKTIGYHTSDNEYKETAKPYLNLKIIKIGDIGTDPSQSEVLHVLTINSTGLNLDTEVCTEVQFEPHGELLTGLKYVKFDDSATGNFGLSLVAVVSRTNQQWFKQNYRSEIN